MLHDTCDGLGWVAFGDEAVGFRGGVFAHCNAIGSNSNDLCLSTRPTTSCQTPSSVAHGGQPPSKDDPEALGIPCRPG